MAGSARNPAYRRYLRRMLPISIAYVAAVALASRLVPDHAPASVATVSLALVPGMAVLGWIWAMARLLVELDDEYLRLLEIRKFLVATGVMLAVTSIWGLLEFHTDVPRLPVFFAFPIWCAGLVVGQIVNRLTLGDGGCA